MTGSSHVSFAHPGPRGRRPVGWSVAAVAVAAALAASPAAVRAQIYLPSDPPTEVLAEDFEDASAFDVAWTLEGTHDLAFGDWASSSVGCAGSGHWGLQALRQTASDASGAPGAMLVATSIPEDPSFSAYDWTSYRLEVDFSVSSAASRVGFVWAGSQDLLGVGNGRDNAYVVVVEDAQTAASAAAGGRARWRLYKRTGDSTMQVNTGLVQLPSSAGTTVLQGGCYRLRLEWFCGNLQVSIRRFVYDASCPGGCASGCNLIGADPCTPGEPERCWCSFIRWTDPMPLDPGATGIFTGGSGAAQATYLDNFSAGTWGVSCASICAPWSPYSESWAVAGEARDTIRFKHLFEGGLMDQRYGLQDTGMGRIDADVLEPIPEIGEVDGFCNGWRVLVDLPDPTASAGANVGDMRKFLEPIATAVQYEDDGNVYTADAAFVDTFDNDPASLDYNPIPLVASGTTPLAAALKDAYDWYVANLSPGGIWADDPLALCRNWYVVLITDGEESCQRRAAGETPAACEAGQAGAPAALAGNSFADPLSTTGVPLRPVPVNVVGFSAGAGGGTIACAAANTGGEYLTAQNASQLADTLYDIVNFMLEEDRAFVPVAVSPSTTAQGATGDYLVLVPQFVPENQSPIWDGHLYAFRLTSTQRTVPVIPPGEEGEGMIDTSLALWDASDALGTQLSGASPVRHTFWPRLSGSTWTRVPLESVPGDATLKAEFETLLDHTGGVDPTEVQEIVDFLRFFDPTARPVSYPLGDIFHSSPAVIAPPNYFPYYNNGVHDYADFVTDNQYRRKVVMVGANDGLLHAFDVGAYDRDETNFDNRFDFGTGRELFSVLPLGVMDRVYNLVNGTEQQYLVDGGTVSADVFVTPPGASDREWRTMSITALQQGGRSYLALDVTHPDPPGTIGSGMPADAACLDGSASGCTGVYPRVAWELTDTSDEDGNCPGGLIGDQCAPYWDLGRTWSPPAVARVKQDSVSSPGGVDDMFVAFFGGGWDDQNYKREAYSSLTGNFFYGVDVGTGEIVYKQAIPGSMVPGGVSTLDADADGFVDRVYFGDTTGGLWRLNVTAEAAFSGTPPRVTNWALTKIYQLPVEQEFFNRPVVVPALFSGGAYTWALAIGSGDRANVTLEDEVENRFYVVLDMGDNVTRTEANLHGIMVDPPDPLVAAGTSYLNPPTTYGWYLHLRPNEKVNADAIVAGQKVLFNTFEPRPMEIDPNDPRCVAIGVGRLYEVFFSNANSLGEDGQQNPPGSPDPRDEDLEEGLIAGGTAYTIGDTTVAQFTTWEGQMVEREIALYREHVVTNWRQD